MPEPVILLIGLLVAGVFVVLPLLRIRSEEEGDHDRTAAGLRHRVALEALRDVETDRAAGSLDDAAYAAELAQAEEHAAITRSVLDAQVVRPAAPAGRRGLLTAVVAAGGIGLALLGGSLMPATGIGNSTDVNQSLAAAQATEAERLDRIEELRGALADDPDAETVSALADAYLAGSTRDDLVRAAVSLQLLIELAPGRADAYERIMSAYLRAGDAVNARAAHDSYTDLEYADPAEAAFFDGLIALRGENDDASAVAAFDRFLELAPDDPRAGMIRGLREEAAAGS